MCCGVQCFASRIPNSSALMESYATSLMTVDECANGIALQHGMLRGTHCYVAFYLCMQPGCITACIASCMQSGAWAIDKCPWESSSAEKPQQPNSWT